MSFTFDLLYAIRYTLIINNTDYLLRVRRVEAKHLIN